MIIVHTCGSCKISIPSLIPGGGGGGGGVLRDTLIFLYIRRLGSFLGGSKL